MVSPETAAFKLLPWGRAILGLTTCKTTGRVSGVTFRVAEALATFIL
jgi:hypothetical protein